MHFTSMLFSLFSLVYLTRAIALPEVSEISSIEEHEFPKPESDNATSIPQGLMPPSFDNPNSAELDPPRVCGTVNLKDHSSWDIIGYNTCMTLPAEIYRIYVTRGCTCLLFTKGTCALEAGTWKGWIIGKYSKDVSRDHVRFYRCGVWGPPE